METRKTKIIKNVLWVIRAIWNYDKRYIVIMGITMVMFSLIPSCSTLLAQNILNALQQHLSIKILALLIGIYVGIDFIQAVVEYLVEYYKYKFSLGFNLHFRNIVLQKSSRLTLKDYENSEMYDMISRAQYETDGKLLNYFEAFVGIFASLITTVSYLVIVVRFRIWLVFVILIIPIIKYFINRMISLETFSVLMRRTNDSRKCWYMQHLITNGEAYKELRIYNLFSYFIGQFMEYSTRFNREDLKLKKKGSVRMGGASLVESGIDGGLFAYVILCCAKGEILIGSVTAYMQAISQVKNQITVALQTASGLSQESLYIDQLQAFLKLPEDEVVTSHGVSEIQTIRVDHLSYRYREQEEYVLKDVSFTLKRGQSIAVVGQNGSGKTTLLKILMGFYKDYEGNVYINDVELRELQSEELMERIATLFQDFFQYEATFRENIAYGNLSNMNDNQRLIAICKKFQLDTLVEETEGGLDCQIGYLFDEGKQVSLGQWQRIGLARAFSKNADLYIMDEPNAALDAITEYRLAKLYSELLEGKIGIIVAHKFNHIIKYVNQVLILENGEVTGMGSHDELLGSNTTYKTLYEIQVG